MPLEDATSRIFASGPTRIGTISPFSAASTAPASDVASTGCATAVVAGSRLRHLASSASYFPVPEIGDMSTSWSKSTRQPRRRARFLQEQREQHREPDAEQHRRERRLLVFEPHLGRPASEAEQRAAKDRRQQGAEGEIQEIYDARRRPARLRRVGFLDDGV